MTTARSYTIAGTLFPTQTLLRAHIQRILHGHEPGIDLPIGPLRFLRDLLELHPDADRKIGIGVRWMTVEIGKRGTREFWLERPDRTRTEWSYEKCLRKPPPDLEFKAACRTAIVAQKLAFRDRAFGGSKTIPCALTGVLVGADDCHVDHEPPATFAKILGAFVDENKIDVAAVVVLGRGDGEVERRLADPELTARWCAFHAQRWRPRITTAKANLTQRRTSDATGA